jgi:hypothetical protein
MTATTDSRKAAQDKIRSLMNMIEREPASDDKTALLEECESLARAIAAFHMEGIRFRSFNVDRLLHRGGPAVPAGSLELFAEMRKDLEAAGFHTRSHQAPG